MLQIEPRRLTKVLIMGFKFRERHLERKAGLMPSGKRRVISVSVEAGISDCPGLRNTELGTSLPGVGVPLYHF